MPDEILQPIPSENPVPPETTPVQKNVSQTSPVEPTQPEETKITEPIPATELTPETPLTNPDVTIKKTPDTGTVTEVVEPFRQAQNEPPVPEAPKDTPDKRNFLKGLLPKLKEKLSFRTEKRLSKIMELARKNGEIQNDDVEKLLHVSDASASRYLEKLVRKGNLRVSGPKNHAKYTPN